VALTPAPGAAAGAARVRSPGRWGRASIAGYAAATWSATYALLGLYWTFGGKGFPFGAGDPDPGIGKGLSILGAVRQDTAAPVIAACGLTGAVLAVLLAARRTGRTAEPIAWAVAILLGIVLPDYRPLVAAGHIPVFLVGKPFGFPHGVTIASQLPWPVVNQMLCMLGAALFAAAALTHRRARLDACLACGRTDTPTALTAPDRAAQWGVIAVWIAAIVPGIYALTRWAWALGIPIGFSAQTLRDMDRENPGIWVGGAALATMGLIGSVLTFGFVRRWGEVFPRWIPVLRGRRVPISLAVVPAMAVALLVTSAGLMMTRILLTRPTNASSWAAMGPAILWPLWGAALAAAALAYYYRRRGACKRCGRGHDATSSRGADSDGARREQSEFVDPGNVSVA
jgi:hypothetical protein